MLTAGCFLLYCLFDGAYLAYSFGEEECAGGAGLCLIVRALYRQSLPASPVPGGHHHASRPHRSRLASHCGAYGNIYGNGAGPEHLSHAAAIRVALTDWTTGFRFHGAGAWPGAYQPDGGRTQLLGHGQRAWFHAG